MGRSVRTRRWYSGWDEKTNSKITSLFPQKYYHLLSLSLLLPFAHYVFLKAQQPRPIYAALTPPTPLERTSVYTSCTVCFCRDLVFLWMLKMFLNFIFWFTSIIFTRKISGSRMTPLEERGSRTASAVALGLCSQSHTGSESAAQGQEQGVCKKMMDIKPFDWLWLQKGFAFWKLNLQSLWPDQVLLCQENFPWICGPESFFPGGIINPNVLLLVISPAWPELPRAEIQNAEGNLW